MAVTQWLIDKSALTRIQLGQTPDVILWNERMERGLVHLPAVGRLEVGYSVRNGDDGRTVFSTPPISRLPIAYLTPRAEDRAHEVQMLLADRGQHRAASIADLLIAAMAEVAKLTVLAVDKDFELIAEVTKQRVERLR